jgi:hypothetical protein
MRAYYAMDRSTSACVRFVRNAELDDDLHEVFAEIRSLGFRCVYVDLRVSHAGDVLANQVAHALQPAHAPYTRKHWVCFLDDLITLAHREKGLVIVVDGGWLLLEQRRDELFDLIEASCCSFITGSNRQSLAISVCRWSPIAMSLPCSRLAAEDYH